MALALTIEDLRRMAKRRVPKMFYDYADSGAWTESTYRDNEAAFGRILLRQRVARNIDSRSVASTMLGNPVAMPVALAPVGMTGMQHADGEILACRAAQAFGVPFTLSTMSICSIEDVAAAVDKPFWFQLYVMRDRGFVEDMIARAKAAKCSALVLTLDLQILGQRHKDLRNGLSAPPKPTPAVIADLLTKPGWCLEMMKTKRRSFGNIVGHAPGVTSMSSLVDWIRERWDGPLILKGINDVEDAETAAATGAEAMIVSNHGGRQLDGAVASIEMLAPIVDVVGDRAEVYVDGGIRSGQDILKALAIGAKSTFIGRAFVYGLGAMGEAGVTRALEILRKELDITMALCGETDVRDLGRHNLVALPPQPQRLAPAASSAGAGRTDVAAAAE
jgi:L-lactate dehydrogenase (cytochrome)